MDLFNSKAAIQKLKELEVKQRAAASPSMPIKYIIPTKYTDKTANGLTKCVIDWLRLNNWQAERINNTGRQLANKWIKGTGTNGTADISATVKGRSIKIEVKIGADRQSEAQKAYQLSIEKSGGIYLISKDFSSFMQWYSKFVDA